MQNSCAGWFDGARRVFAIGLLACVCAGVHAGSADASTVDVNCAELQATMDVLGTQAGHGEGDVIVLDEMCKEGPGSSGFIFPEGASFSLEGEGGAHAGFEGAGSTMPLLYSESDHPAGKLSISNLAFRYATTDREPGGGGLSIAASSLQLEHDAFVGNTVYAGRGAGAYVMIGGAAPCSAAGTVSLSITGTAFLANTLVTNDAESDGGGLAVAQLCASTRTVMQDDGFFLNFVEASGEFGAGGGLALLGPSTEAPATVSQTDLRFEDNKVIATHASGDYGGGGEWIVGANLTSVGNRFSQNTIPGTSGAQSWSWGAGLGLFNSNCSASATESTLEDAVVEGNAIGAGEAGDGGGAGIGMGCGDASPTADNRLNLLDSTVTENNNTGGGVAGVDGQPGDHLRIGNSIVAEDEGGGELGGFTAEARLLRASYSDVCQAGSLTVPLEGAGNICADPRLSDDGEPESDDVSETEDSPTIDAGANALVPEALTTDFYGQPRLEASLARDICGSELLGPAVADMGAAEYSGTVVRQKVEAECRVPPPNGPSPATSSNGSQSEAGSTSGASNSTPIAPMFATTLAPATFPLADVRRSARGSLALSFTGITPGTLSVIATFAVTRTITRLTKGDIRHDIKQTERIVYARASCTVSSMGDVTIELRPTSKASSWLARLKRLRVLLSITFTPAGHATAVRAQAITITYAKPGHRHP